MVRIGPRELGENCTEDGVKTVYGGGLDQDEWYARAFHGEGYAILVLPSTLLGDLAVGLESGKCLLHFRGKAM